MTNADDWVYGDSTPDPLSHDLIGLKAEWILRQLPPLENPAVLDFGTGEGKYLQLIRGAKPRARLVGVDVRSPRHPSEFEFHLVPDDTPLPFADSQFDVVVSCDVLEHVGSARHVLDELHRVLRIGGRFIGFVPLEGGWGPHALLRLVQPNIYLDTKDHRHAYSRGEMLALLRDRFPVSRFAYSYHALGGTLDAAFFASFKLPVIGNRVEAFWRGQDNSFYRKSGGRPSMLGRLTRAANQVAYWESRLLRHVALGASGLHFCLEKT